MKIKQSQTILQDKLRKIPRRFRRRHDPMLVPNMALFKLYRRMEPRVFEGAVRALQRLTP